MPGKPTAKKTSAARKKSNTVKAAAATKKSGASQLLFRARTPNDDDYIVQLTEQQLAGVHQQAFGEAFPREQFRRYLQSGAPTVIVEQGKKRIGYYSYLVNPDGKLHISAMVIEPEHQSDGIGSKVMRHLEEEAKEKGVNTLEVFVQTANDKSLAFTRKLGFVEAFYVTPTTLCFQKRLSPPPAAQGDGTSQQPGVAASPFPPAPPMF